MAKGVTVDLIVDPKGAIEGLDKVSSKSTAVSGVMGKLGSVAAAGLIALGTAAVAAVAGLTAATKSAGEYAETVELAASKTHLSTDAVQELQYASKVTGVDFETISGSLTKLTKSVGLAAGGNAKAADAFAQLGVATTDANGNLRDSPAIYADVIDALGQVANPTERDILAMTLLGKSATALNPLIDGTAGSLSELAAQAHDAGAVLSEDMLAKLSSVDDAFDTLGLGVDAAKNALGLTLMPILQELGTQGTGLLGDFTHAVLDANGDLSKAAPAIGAVFGDAIAFLLGQIPAFLEVGTSIVGALLSGIVSQAPTLITAAVPVLVGFVTTILGMLPTLLDAGAKVLIALVQGVAAALPELIPAAASAIVGLVGALVDNLPLLLAAGLDLLNGLAAGLIAALPTLISAAVTAVVGLVGALGDSLPLLLDAGLQLLTGLATGLISALPTLIAALPQIILSLVTFLIGAIPQLITAGVTLLTSLVGALPTIITAIVEALPQIIVGIITAVLAAIPQLITAGIDLFIGLIGALPQIIIALVNAVPQIITGLVKAFTDPKTLKKLGDAGLKLIQGLWEGIKGAGDWLWKQISGFFGGVIEKIRGLLGIHSPSTVFSGFGKNLVQGLAAGISGSAGLAASAMSDLSQQVTSGFAGSLSVQASSSALVASGAGIAGGQVVVNVPVTNSFVGDRDQLARELTKTIQNGLRTGTVPADWNTK